MINLTHARHSGFTTLLQLEAFDFLATREHPIAMSELAHQLGVSSASVTNLADHLEKSGLVERRPVPGDRRLMHLAVTASGHSTHHTLHTT